MTIWVDAQLSPKIASWMTQTFAVDAIALRDVGLRDATDQEIFRKARKASVTVMTKDGDFIRLLDEHGPPPRVIWITCGNTSNVRLKTILTATLPRAFELLAAAERLVEINAI
jgi:predicted nuclease of predicted toxin-antitoxin system